MSNGGIRTVPVSALLLCLALSALGLKSQAQTDPEATAEPAAPEQPDKTEQNTASEAPEADQPSDSSPFDYKSSEEISEDLSVSFPVDI